MLEGYPNSSTAQFDVNSSVRRTRDERLKSTDTLRERFASSSTITVVSLPELVVARSRQRNGPKDADFDGVIGRRDRGPAEENDPER